MNNSILVFACDHHRNIEWNLPYIRFGGPESDCAIQCQNKIFDIDVNADETPKLFWLWKNLDQFGCQYIGYCQYRRFFTKLSAYCPVLNVSAETFNKEYAMTPTDQLILLSKTNADGILHPAFNVIDKNTTPFKYIWEQIYILEKEKMLHLKYQKLAFDILLSNTPTEYKEFMEKAFEISENYLCNIFTAKKDIFKLFGEIAFLSARDLLQIIPFDERSCLHPYWLAYLFERYTNCFFHCLELSGKHKFIKIPLMTIDANKHIKWEQQTKNNILQNHS